MPEMCGEQKVGPWQSVEMRGGGAWRRQAWKAKPIGRRKKPLESKAQAQGAGRALFLRAWCQLRPLGLRFQRPEPETQGARTRYLVCRARCERKAQRTHWESIKNCKRATAEHSEEPRHGSHAPEAGPGKGAAKWVTLAGTSLRSSGPGVPSSPRQALGLVHSPSAPSLPLRPPTAS